MFMDFVVVFVVVGIVWGRQVVQGQSTTFVDHPSTTTTTNGSKTFTSCSATLLQNADQNNDLYIDEIEFITFLQTIIPSKCPLDLQSLLSSTSTFSTLYQAEQSMNTQAQDEETSDSSSSQQQQQPYLTSAIWDIIGCYCLNFEKEDYNQDVYCCKHNTTISTPTSTSHSLLRRIAVPGSFYPEPYYSDKLCSFIDQTILVECHPPILTTTTTTTTTTSSLSSSSTSTSSTTHPQNFNYEESTTNLLEKEEQAMDDSPTTANNNNERNNSAIHETTNTNSHTIMDKEATAIQGEDYTTLLDRETSPVQQTDLPPVLQEQEKQLLLAMEEEEDNYDNDDDDDDEEDDCGFNECVEQLPYGITLVVLIIIFILSCCLFLATFLAEGTGAGAKDKSLKKADIEAIKNQNSTKNSTKHIAEEEDAMMMIMEHNGNDCSSKISEEGEEESDEDDDNQSIDILRRSKN